MIISNYSLQKSSKKMKKYGKDATDNASELKPEILSVDESTGPSTGSTETAKSGVNAGVPEVTKMLLTTILGE